MCLLLFVENIFYYLVYPIPLSLPSEQIAKCVCMVETQEKTLFNQQLRALPSIILISLWAGKLQQGKFSSKPRVKLTWASFTSFPVQSVTSGKGHLGIWSYQASCPEMKNKVGGKHQRTSKERSERRQEVISSISKDFLLSPLSSLSLGGPIHLSCRPDIFLDNGTYRSRASFGLEEGEAWWIESSWTASHVARRTEHDLQASP